MDSAKRPKKVSRHNISIFQQCPFIIDNKTLVNDWNWFIILCIYIICLNYTFKRPKFVTSLFLSFSSVHISGRGSSSHDQNNRVSLGCLRCKICSYITDINYGLILWFAITALCRGNSFIDYIENVWFWF